MRSLSIDLRFHDDDPWFGVLLPLKAGNSRLFFLIDAPQAVDGEEEKCDDRAVAQQDAACPGP